MNISKKDFKGKWLDIEVGSRWNDTKIRFTDSDELLPVTVCHIHIKVDEIITVDLRIFEMDKIRKDHVRQALIKNVPVSSLTAMKKSAWKVPNPNFIEDGK